MTKIVGAMGLSWRARWWWTLAAVVCLVGASFSNEGSVLLGLFLTVPTIWVLTRWGVDHRRPVSPDSEKRTARLLGLVGTWGAAQLLVMWLVDGFWWSRDNWANWLDGAPFFYWVAVGALFLSVPVAAVSLAINLKVLVRVRREAISDGK